jgi:hypothetical protein
MDSQLRSRHHIQGINGECYMRFQQMMAVSGTSWGSAAIDMRALYIASVRSKLFYCSPVFSPFLPNSRLRQLDVLDRKALREITGCVRCIPQSDLYREANLPPLTVRFRESIAIAEEKYRRFPKGDPMRVLAQRYVANSSRLRGALQRSWQMVSDSVLPQAGVTTARLNRNGAERPQHNNIQHVALVMHPLTPPWLLRDSHKVHISLDLDEPFDQADGGTVNKDRALRTVLHLRTGRRTPPSATRGASGV